MGLAVSIHHRIHSVLERRVICKILRQKKKRICKFLRTADVLPDYPHFFFFKTVVFYPSWYEYSCFFSCRYIKKFDYGVMLIPLRLMSNIMCAVLSHSVVSTLCSAIDWSPPCSSVHGILQARILEWVAMPSSRGSSQPRD